MKQKIYEQFVKLAITTREVDEEYLKMLTNKYEKLDDSLLWQFACNNRIQSIVGHTLINILGRDNVPAHWVKVHEENFNRISAYLAELKSIQGNFNNDVSFLATFMAKQYLEEIYGVHHFIDI